MKSRNQSSLHQIGLSVGLAMLITLHDSKAEMADWRMKDGTTIKAELFGAWGEGDASMVELITHDSKNLILKRSELDTAELKRIPLSEPRHEDFRFAWATAHPVENHPNQLTITFLFKRTLPGVNSENESTLKVAPFKIGDDLIPPDAWNTRSVTGPDGIIVYFSTTGEYDASKLHGSKFSATMELEIGKERNRMVQKMDFSNDPGVDLTKRVGDFEIKSFYFPGIEEIAPSYTVSVLAEPRQKLIGFLMESNGRTAIRGNMKTKDAGLFATVKIDYWERFEKETILFEGTAGRLHGH
jgi:hypothetical protein